MILRAQAKLSLKKNVALNGVGYLPKTHARKWLNLWFLRVSLRILALAIIIALCHCVEMSQGENFKQVAKTVKDVLVQTELHDAFPVLRV